MKRLLYPLAILGLIIACNPLDEVYDNLDAQQEPYSENIEYTLSSDDYSSISKAALKLAENASDSAKAKLINSQKALNTTFTANSLVGSILGTNFIALNKKSTAIVTYNMNLEDLDYLNAIAGATQYTVTENDYASVGGRVAAANYFIPSSTADENLATILSSSITGAASGDYAIVTYKQSDIEPSGAFEVKLINETFETYAKYDTIDENEWINYIETAASHQTVGSTFVNAWCARQYSDNTYAQMSANKANGLVTSWLITPEVNLTGLTSTSFAFDVNVGFFNGNCLTVKASTNFNPSDPAAATWTDITSNFTIPSTPTSGYGTIAAAGTMDLAAYTGKVRFAFRYGGDGTADSTTTYQIDNVVIRGTKDAKSAKADLFDTYTDIYQYNGSAWKKSTGVRALHKFEYVAMGQSYGNFSSSAPAENYLPTFLASAYPYAQEGDSKIMLYKYYASGATTYVATRYDYTAGIWTPYTGIVVKSDQFVHTGEKWIFDPTVKISPTSSDYQDMVNYVRTTHGSQYVDSYGTAEFYFGMSAYYTNFDLRLSTRTSFTEFNSVSEDVAVALTWTRLEEGLTILLGRKYPDAVAEITGGIQVYYWVTFATYENNLAKKSYTGVFQYSESDAKFVRMKNIESQEVANGNLTESSINWNR